MESKARTAETCIVVMHVRGTEIGIIVDKVSEVMRISANDIDPAPSFGNEVTTEYILGIGKSQGRVKILLDIDKVLSTNEIIRPHLPKDASDDESLKKA
jgi:purine-binding chemotaxis protein CheW